MADNRSKSLMPASVVALSYVPVVFAQLDSDGKEMLCQILQATRDGGYEDGYADGFEGGKSAYKNAGKVAPSI